MKTRGLAIVLMVVLAVSRWPRLMPENFSAVYAMALCAGFYFPPRLAWLPLATILGSDIALNLFFYHTSFFSGWMLPNYVAYVVLFFLGRSLARASFLGKVCAGLAGAIIFYLVTNTAAWWQIDQYPKTLAGWFQALTVGTPGWPHTWEFFRNTLLSGGLFTALFAGSMTLGKKEVQAEEMEPAEEAQPASDEAAA